MDLELKGKVAVVTGGARGIGAAIVKTFASEEANVSVVDMDEEGAKRTAGEIKGMGVDSLAIKTDVTKLDDTDAMAKAVLDKFGKIDILVNNAGIFIIKQFGKTTPEEWNREINVNFYGAVNCVRSVIDHMIEKNYGKIINMGSDAGRVGEPTQPIYSGAKAGVIAFTKAIAKDVGRHNINVNVVCPSLTETRGAADAIRGEGAAIESLESDAILRVYPIGRLGKPEDIANTVVFLASERARHITGQTISINGGYAML